MSASINKLSQKFVELVPLNCLLFEHKNSPSNQYSDMSKLYLLLSSTSKKYWFGNDAPLTSYKSLPELSTWNSYPWSQLLYFG